MNHKIIYCGNCGKKGHVYKNCYKPIISLGIMCIKYENIDINQIMQTNKNQNKIFNRYSVIPLLNDKKIKKIIDSNLKFLMVCRKHSLGYIEFIRGNYNLDNYRDIEYINNIFKMMTKRELQIIKTHTFNDLWNDLWVLKETNLSHKKEYDQSKFKFEKLTNGLILKSLYNEKYINLQYFLECIKNYYNEPDWEFPKGRRNIKEEDLPCAIREFEEETGYKDTDYKLLDLKPISEIFMGNNGINYKHTYYLAQCFNDNIIKIDENNFYQQIEISDIEWLTFNEAMNKIRDYSISRKEILNKVYNMIYFNIYHYLKKT